MMNSDYKALNVADDVVYNIFLLIPVEILHKTMKLVCRQWRRIIENRIFIRQHMLNSDVILLKQINYDHAFSRCNVKVQNNSLHSVIETMNHVQFPGRVLSSVDGLLMCANRYRRHINYVSNPVTKEVVEIRECPVILYTGSQVILVPVVSTVEYKLVARYLSIDSLELHVYITSIGRENELWRRIDHHYPKDVGAKIPEQFVVSAIPVEGFIYWAKHNCSYIISLDMKTEKFVEFPAPAVDVQEDKAKDVYYIKMKNKLSCIHCKDWRNSLAVYLLEASKITGIYEWSKIYEIDWNSRCFDPLAWTKNGEVLISIYRYYYYYTQQQSEVVAFNMVSKSRTYFRYSGVNTPGTSCQLPHVDSLVSLVSPNEEKSYCKS